jgi:ABC-type branched-subunit amino acid transport system ATPase component
MTDVVGVAAETPPGSASPALLELRSISVRFGGVHALRDVSFDLAPGEVVGVIGPNGAGKTTLFDVISGVRPPTGGSISFAGRDVTGTGAVKRSRMGMRRTFQRSQPFGWLSVEDNILVALEAQGRGRFLADLVGLKGRQDAARREHVAQILDRFGLTTAKDVAAGRLPIGTIRMVELARAVIGQPSLLLLDEPTSGLDHAEAEILAQAIADVRSQDDCTVLLVEHDVPFVMATCDRVIALNLGSVLASGSPAEVRANPAVRDAYFG